MKQFFCLLLVSSLLAVLVSCTDEPQNNQGNFPIDEQTQQTDATQATLTGLIAQRLNSSILLAESGKHAAAGSIYFVDCSSVEVTDQNGVSMDQSGLLPGMTVRISYSGLIQESYPMQPSAATAIQIVEQGADLLGLYQEIMTDLYEQDTALNSEIRYLAFDFSQLEHISEAEKSALTYSIGTSYSLETLTGTYEELCEQGYIDADHLLFEDGLLFQISDEPAGNGEFSFSASTWRGGNGAIGIEGIASLTDGIWSYSVVESWIS